MRRPAALLASAALLCCICLAVPAAADASARGAASSRALRAASGSALPEAYATFVVSEDYVLGARVLGQSLRESGTTRYAPVCGKNPRCAR